MSDQNSSFAVGCDFFEPNPNAPDFVVGDIRLTLEDVAKLFAENSAHVKEYNGKKQLRIRVLRSKQGKVYTSVNTYNGQANSTAAAPPAGVSTQQRASTAATEPVDDLPF
jgi:hypothetical protein